MNTIVGAGSLVTFPTLLFFGYPPLMANVSNTVGLVTGGVSGAIGFRRELSGQRDRARRLVLASFLGGLTGGLLLLALPASAFERIVPILILFACALVAVQPRLSTWIADRRARRGAPHGEGGLALVAGVFLTGVYGGYFGAAQGVILIAILGTLVADSLLRLNALKVVLSGVVNAVAAVLFILVTPIAWLPAILIAAGSIVGGQLGAHIGRRLSPVALRVLIIVLGTVVAGKMLLG